MKDFEIILKVNERDYPLKVSPNRTLLEVLREDLGLTGTKINCEAGECGVCTVILDGRAINSCTCLAVLADGIPITTIEGLAGPDGLHPVQEAFVQNAAVQCGYCTPGIIMAAVAWMTENPRTTNEEMYQAVA
ncbi:MAG: (2Fe-2S)-binding protein, partial [Gammaproteobacteria bacterium]|nr:(2Fe-2S)-binding protein [Gammaproteobacteria bacterium]